MKTEQLRAWFKEDRSRWDALSPQSKEHLWHVNPYKASKEIRWKRLGGTRGQTRNKLLVLANGTLTVSEMAEQLCLDPNTVYARISYLRSQGRDVQFKKQKRGRKAPEFGPNPILSLADGKLTRTEVAERLDISRATLHFAVKHLRSQGHDVRFANAWDRHDIRKRDGLLVKRDILLSKIISLADGRLTIKEVADRLGTRAETIRHYADVIRNQGKNIHFAERRHPLVDDIIRLRSEGLTFREIGEKLGYNSHNTMALFYRYRDKK